MDAQRLLRVIDDGVATIMDRLLPSRPTPSQMTHGRRLAETLRSLDAESATASGSPFWRSICRDLARFAGEDDPLFFMRWPPVRATMVHGTTLSGLSAWWMLRHAPDWSGTWKPALRHPQHGHPPPFIPMMSTNVMAVEHASHLFRFRQETGASLHDSECIIEFGGGFGSMCRLIHALGFTGTYIIFDLPPILALQRYYLALHGIMTDGSDARGVRLCDDLARIAGLLRDGGFRRVSLISTWALSEMPMPLRQSIEPFLSDPACDKALFSYQAAFEGTDNRRYFGDLMARTSGRFVWRHVPIRPSDALSASGSNYLFGMGR